MPPNSDQPWGTQSTGWADAWMSSPSVYAVAAKNAGDVAAAVDFAREHNLRLVVKGGGHSYLETSNAPDSLLIWTRDGRDRAARRVCAAGLQRVAATGGIGRCRGDLAAYLRRGYDQVRAPCGGCAMVGVARLVQSGEFGAFSKNYGTAAASLLEAEVVTADGAVRIANACSNPDLLWALKGGGGGSFGVITRLTLKTHELTERAGAAILYRQGDIGPGVPRTDPQIRRVLCRAAVYIGAEGSLSNATKRCRSKWCRTV